MKTYFKLAFLAVCVFLVAKSLASIKKFVLSEFQMLQSSKRKVLIGAWTQDFWNNQTKMLDVQKLSDFETDIQKKVAIAHYYRGWDELESPNVIADWNQMADHGWVPLVSSNPYFTPKCTTGKVDIYSAIASGNCDQLIQDMAKRMATYGKPLLFRFAWEMNIDSNPWSVQAAYSTPVAFVAAWQHMHQLFVSAGATNVQWVFAVNVAKANSVAVAELYPGDAFVDWTGLDGYNWGTSQSWSHWSSFDEVFHTTYQDLTAVAPTKPLMISEFNSVADNGGKAAWMADALNIQIPDNYPAIKAVIFFNEDKTVAEGVDWRIETSQAVLETVKKSLQSSIYLSTFPVFGSQ